MLITMANKKVPLEDVVYQMMKYNPVWVNRNKVIIYSNETVELETGIEKEIIAEYTVNRAELKKVVNKKL